MIYTQLFFFDTEFIENGKTIDLLSIGIVGQDGSEFYAVNVEADLSKASPWVQENVIPYLDPEGTAKHSTRQELAMDIFYWVSAKPQFWAYFSDYDWVVLCQLYGTMMQLPPLWPRFCMDLKQWHYQLGSPTLPAQDPALEHNALEDARWNKKAWEFLTDYRNNK